MDNHSPQEFPMMNQQQQIIKPQGSPYFGILSHYSHKWIYITCVLFNIVGGVLPYFIMMNLGSLVNSFNNTDTFLHDVVSKLKMMAIYAAVMIFILNTSFILRSFSDTTFVKDMRDSMFKRIMSLDAAFFDDVPTGALMNRLSEDVTFLLSEYVDKFMNFVQNASQVVGGIIIGFVINWRIALTGIAIVPVTFITLLICGRIIQKEIFKCRFMSAALLGKTEEVLSNFRTVKMFDNELNEIKEYSKQLDQINSNAKKIATVNAVKNAVLTFFTLVMAMPIFYYGSFLILKKNESGVEPGDVIVLFTIFGMLGFPIQLTVFAIENFAKASIAALKILCILNRKPFIDQKVGKKLIDVEGKIEFINVSFKYPTRTEYVLKNVSFVINPGETVAFVGESGSGKTTIAQLIQRLYEIDEGQILIDGKNIQEYSPESLRRFVAIVSQEPTLFTMSVADNIRFCQNIPTQDMDEKIIQAARLGNAHDFITEFPNNYETIINPRNLSGGQKQRICISRAIFANTPILIFDEATSYLDSESEQLVQNSIEQIKSEKTSIIIAHRLSTIMKSNKIFVFKNGSIVESGSHKELMDHKNYYFDLFKFQQS